MRPLVSLFLVLLLLGALAAPAAAQSPTTSETPTTSVRTDILPGVGPDRVLTNLIDGLTDDNVYTFNFEGNTVDVTVSVGVVKATSPAASTLRWSQGSP